jgi:tetratricopeptide (TPR) repeat protein
MALLLALTSGVALAKKEDESRYPNASRTAPKSDLTSSSDQKALQAGLDALNAGEDTKALELLQKVLDTSKSKYARGIALEGIGNAKYNSQDYAGAIAAFKQLLELNSVPNDAYFDSMYYLAAAYAADGQYQAALDQLKTWREQGKRETADSYALEGNAYYQLHKYPEAIAAIKKAQSLSDHPKESWNSILMASYAETGQSAQAAGVIDEQLAKDPTNKQLIHNALVIYIQTDQVDKALALLERERKQGLIDSEGDYVSAAKFYANIAQSGDKPDVAVKGAELLQEGIAKNIVKASADNYKLEGDLYLVAQEQDKALAAYNKAAPLASNGDIDYTRAQLLGAQQNWAEAKSVIQKAIARGVSHKGKAYLLLGKLDLALGDKAGAKTAFQQAEADAETRAEAAEQLQKLQAAKK